MSTMSMRRISQLARVQRPVVSMWRTRTQSSEDPFPAPVADRAGAPQFDTAAVAAWLERTGHGNNPDAVLDAAAFASIEEAASPLEVEALLTLRALHGAPIAALPVDSLQQLARELDADDAMFASEIEHAQNLPALAAHIDALVDADYSAAAALLRILSAREQMDHALALSAPAMELVTGLLLRLRSVAAEQTGIAPTVVMAASAAHPLLQHLLGSEDLELDVAVRASDADARSVRRLTAVLGQGLRGSVVAEDAAIPDALHVLHMPMVGSVDADRCLAQIEDVALGLPPGQFALVFGPAAVLVDPLQGRAELIRSQLLRQGQVRAALRLPRGCAPTAPRAHLGVWIVGAPRGDVPMAERVMITADLDGVTLTEDVSHDVVLDALSGLGTHAERRRRAFRFGAPVAISRILARRGSLVAPHRHLLAAIEPRDEVAARFLAAQQTVHASGQSLPPITTSDGQHEQLRPTVLGDLIDARAVRRLPGTRIDDALLTDDQTRGVRVITPAVVRGDADQPCFVDRLRLPDLGRGARLTNAGDVIFVGGERPAAIVDERGAHLVEYPAAVLRVDVMADAALSPTVLAHDIGRFAQGAWRTWLVRRLPEHTHPAVRSSISAVRDRIDALQQQIGQLAHYERALVDGFVAGVLAPAPAAIDDNDNTEGGQ